MSASAQRRGGKRNGGHNNDITLRSMPKQKPELVTIPLLWDDRRKRFAYPTGFPWQLKGIIRPEEYARAITSINRAKRTKAKKCCLIACFLCGGCCALCCSSDKLQFVKEAVFEPRGLALLGPRVKKVQQSFTAHNAPRHVATWLEIRPSVSTSPPYPMGSVHLGTHLTGASKDGAAAAGGAAAGKAAAGAGGDSDAESLAGDKGASGQLMSASAKGEDAMGAAAQLPGLLAALDREQEAMDSDSDSRSRGSSTSRSYDSDGSSGSGRHRGRRRRGSKRRSKQRSGTLQLEDLDSDDDAKANGPTPISLSSTQASGEGSDEEGGRRGSGRRRRGSGSASDEDQVGEMRGGGPVVPRIPTIRVTSGRDIMAIAELAKRRKEKADERRRQREKRHGGMGAGPGAGVAAKRTKAQDTKMTLLNNLPLSEKARSVIQKRYKTGEAPPAGRPKPKQQPVIYEPTTEKGPEMSMTALAAQTRQYGGYGAGAYYGGGHPMYASAYGAGPVMMAPQQQSFYAPPPPQPMGGMVPYQHAVPQSFYHASATQRHPHQMQPQQPQQHPPPQPQQPPPPGTQHKASTSPTSQQLHKVAATLSHLVASNDGSGRKVGGAAPKRTSGAVAAVHAKRAARSLRGRGQLR